MEQIYSALCDDNVCVLLKAFKQYGSVPFHSRDFLSVALNAKATRCFLHLKNFWSPKTVNAAILENLPDMVKFFLSKSCPTDVYTTNYAAQISAKMLRIVLYYRVPWGIGTLSAAAKVGNVECMKIALEGGCEKNTNVFFQALKGRSLEAIKFCIDNSFPFGKTRVINTEMIKDPVVYEFCLKNGVPIESSLLINLLNKGEKKKITQLFEHRQKDIISSMNEGTLVCSSFTLSLLAGFFNREQLKKFLSYE